MDARTIDYRTFAPAPQRRVPVAASLNYALLDWVRDDGPAPQENETGEEIVL